MLKMTEEERRLEDIEQIEYLRNYELRKKQKRKERINKIKEFLGGKR